MKKVVLVLALMASPAGVLPALANFMCGVPPIPPVGCKVGPCVCDQYGRNCQWTFVCT